MLDYPDYVFSEVKKRSYVDNAKMHTGKKQLFKIDLAAFFPSISREKIFRLFLNDFKMSPDVAWTLTNFTTIDLDLIPYKNIQEINEFLKMKGVRIRNHLISGAPTSQLLSNLANQDLFDRLHSLAVQNKMAMTVYVDDVVFSSNHVISTFFKTMVKSIVSGHHYKLSVHKVKHYTRAYPKKVTGVIIDKSGMLAIPHPMHLRIINHFRWLKQNPDDKECRQKLIGLVEASRQIIPGAFPEIRAYLYGTNR